MARSMSKRRLYLFSTPTCSGCKQLKNQFDAEGLEYEEIDCTEDIQRVRNLINKCEVKNSVPVTVILEGSDVRYWQAGTTIDLNEISSIMSGAR